MNLKQAKRRVDEISRSTGTKNPKVLVAELCGVIKGLIGELEKIQNPPVTVLPKRLPEDLELPLKSEPAELPPMMPPPTGQPEFPSPNPSVLPRRRREGNAGDAE